MPWRRAEPEAAEQTDRAVALGRRRVEGERAVVIAEAERLQIEDAADGDGDGNRIGDAELGPVGQQHHGGEMPAGGVTRNADPPGIDAER